MFTEIKVILHKHFLLFRQQPSALTMLSLFYERKQNQDRVPSFATMESLCGALASHSSYYTVFALQFCRMFAFHNCFPYLYLRRYLLLHSLCLSPLRF